MAFAAVTAAAQLRFAATGPIVVHDGAGEATFTLANIGKIPIYLSLRVGSFTDDTSQAVLLNPRVAFTAETGGPLPTRVDPGTSVRIVANVVNTGGGGISSAPLYNGDIELGKLQLVDVDAPLNISITGKGGPDGKLILTNGESAVLTIKSNDAEAYPLDWSFQIAGKTLQSGELQLAPHGTSRIDLQPTDDLYSWTDNVRPATRTGILLLSMHGPPTVARELLPERTLPVTVLMRKLSPGWTSLWSHLFVALILLLGGLLSVVANSVLPIILRKVNLRKQVNELSDRVGGISTHIDPYLRALLRMEQKRIDLLLKRSWAASLFSVETLDTLSLAIDRLSMRLKVAERLDELRRRLDDAAINTPPSISEGIDNKLQLAANQIQSFALTADDVTAANKLLDAAEASLSTLANTEALAQQIAAGFRDLKLRQKLLPDAYYSDLKAAVPGLFEMLNQPFDDPRNVTGPMLFAIDYGIAALQMAFDYAIMRASAPTAAAIGSGSGEDAGQSARVRMVTHQPELVNLLGTLSWPSLRKLRSLVQEMRENIYEEDVLAEIGASDQAKIVLDPRTVRPYLPILFSVRFKDPRFNDAAAIRRLTCKWDFPNELIDLDWKICHFFQGNERNRDEGRDITVSLRVESQKATDAAAQGDERGGTKSVKNALSTTFEIQRAERPSYSRAFAEAVRFCIAFGVALAALLSGALQQIEKLDFVPAMIAILALGFGVDTIKNLMTQTSRKAAA